MPIDIYSLPTEEINEIERILYHVEFTSEETRKSTNPYIMRKQSQDVSKMAVKNTSTDSKNRFSFEVDSLQADAAFKSKLTIDEQNCTVTYHRFLNLSKGRIYIRHLHSQLS